MGVNLDISDASHSCMNMLVAFLLVSRITMSVSRYNNCRSCLGTMILEMRELLQNMTILTRKMQKPSDKEWRNETAYRALLLLRTAMSVVDYLSLNEPAWEVPQLDAEESAEVKRDAQSDFHQVPVWERSEYDETMRVPPIMAFKLRWCLDTSEERLSAQMKEFRALGLYANVNEFMKAYFA